MASSPPGVAGVLGAGGSSLGEKATALRLSTGMSLGSLRSLEGRGLSSPDSSSLKNVSMSRQRLAAGAGFLGAGWGGADVSVAGRPAGEAPGGEAPGGGEAGGCVDLTGILVRGMLVVDSGFPLPAFIGGQYLGLFVKRASCSTFHLNVVFFCVCGI